MKLAFIVVVCAAMLACTHAQLVTPLPLNLLPHPTPAPVPTPTPPTPTTTPVPEPTPTPVPVVAPEPSTPLRNFTVPSSNLTGFDQATAHRFLQYSYAAYCPEASLKAWNCKWCKDSVTYVASLRDAGTDSFGFVVYDRVHNQVVVSYRGSQSLENWIENLKFWKASHPFDGVADAKVAEGFFESYNSVASQTQRAVRQALTEHTNAGLFITGHSLGGALASLAAFDLKQSSGIGSTEVYTFGSPRVGSTGFANAYRARVPTTWRMTNHKDIVPHLPPKAFDFFHVATEVYEVDATYKTCNSGGEDPSCADGQLGDSINDHLHYMQEHETCS